MSMINRIKQRSKEDKGNAVIILGLMLIMALLLVGGLLLDVSKAHQLKSSYIDSAKKATQTAIMEQTPDGYLKPTAAGAAILTYEKVNRPAIFGKENDVDEGYFSRCEDYGDNEVKLKATFVRDNGTSGHSFVITRAGASSYNTAGTLTSRLGITNSIGRDIVNQKYTSIRLEVTEGTENVLLPGAFAITQADSETAVNMKCQQLDIAARANIFTGSTDEYN